MNQTVPVDCEACGNPYAIELLDVVDLEAEPLLRWRLLRGALNYARCPHCGHGAEIDHSFIVLDPVAGRTILFVPEAGETPAVSAAILGNVLAIYQAEDPRPCVANQVRVGDRNDLMALLAESDAT